MKSLLSGLAERSYQSHFHLVSTHCGFGGVTVVAIRHQIGTVNIEFFL
jgi:hypothetical protein